MGLIERYRIKYIESAQQVIGGEAKVLDIALVAAGPNPYMITIVVAGIALAMLAMTGTLVGGPLIALIGLLFTKPRFLVLADRGLVLFRRALISSNMGPLVGITDTATLVTGAGPAQLTLVPLQLGFERVWIRAKDLQRLASHSAASAGGA
jgi:hypothetical protein